MDINLEVQDDVNVEIRNEVGKRITVYHFKLFEILKNQKIVEVLEYRKKHPQAFNYAQFEHWVTDVLKGGDGFPRFTDDEIDKILK